MVWTAGALHVGGEPARGGERPAGRRRDGSGLAGVGVSATADRGHRDTGTGQRSVGANRRGDGEGQRGAGGRPATPGRGAALAAAVWRRLERE